MMMEKERNTKQGLRILYMGMLGTLSTIPLRMMLEHRFNIVGVVVPSGVLPIYERGSKGITAVPPPSLPPLTPAYILDLAWNHDIPLYSVTELNNKQTFQTISALNPDVICVSCFSKRIPPAILTLPQFGCLNLHPSRLPQHRGPHPLFWTFRNGQKETAVTIHFMDEGLDTGDIALQKGITLPNGISGEEANQLCAETGGNAFIDVLHRLYHNLPRHPQPTAGVSHAPTPQPADFSIAPSWSAEHAFNFMRGTAQWLRPFLLKTEVSIKKEHGVTQRTAELHREKAEKIGRKKEIALETAVSFHPTAILPQPLLWQGQILTIQMTPGTLTAQISNNR